VTDKAGEAISAAIYAGMVAYSNEYKRINRQSVRIDARCFKVATDAYNEKFKEVMAEEDFDVIDDEHDPTNPADRMYENEVIK